MQHKYIPHLLIFLGALSLLVILQNSDGILSIQIAHAQQVHPNAFEDPLEKPFSLVAYIILLINALGIIAIRLAEYFLQPELLQNTQMMGENGMLKQIWLITRDITNVLFACMLVGMAFYTITVGNAAKIKEKIILFVLAVILVNFSWFFPRVIIDIANVLTTTVFSIPDLVGGTCKDLDGEECLIITHIELFPVATGEFLQQNNCQGPDEPGPGCKCFRDLTANQYSICWVLERFDEAEGKSHVMVNALMVNYGRITHLARANPEGNAGITQFSKLSFYLTLGFSLFFGLFMLFPILGLAVGLMLRIIILWMTIAFMPFTFLALAINGKLRTDIFGFPVNIWGEFLAAAFLPVFVAFPIAIGFMLILAGSQIPPPTDFPVNFNQPLITGIKNWWQLLWMIFSFAIIWKGAFMALGRSQIIGAVTERIRGAGAGMINMVTSLPLLAPLPVPGPGGKPLNIGQALSIPKMIDQKIREQTSLAKGAGQAKSSASDASIKKAANENSHLLKDIDTHLATVASPQHTALEKKNAYNAMRQALENAGIDTGAITPESDGGEDKLLDVLHRIKNEKGRAKIDAGNLDKADAQNAKTTVTVSGGSGPTDTTLVVNGTTLKLGKNEEHDITDQTKREALINALGVSNSMRGLKAAQQGIADMAAANIRPDIKDALGKIAGRVSNSIANGGKDKIEDVISLP